MSMDDLTKRLDSEQGEKLSDSALDKGEAAASQATGGKHDQQLGAAGDAADKRLGNQ